MGKMTRPFAALALGCLAILADPSAAAEKSASAPTDPFTVRTPASVVDRASGQRVVPKGLRRPRQAGSRPWDG